MSVMSDSARPRGTATLLAASLLALGPTPLLADTGMDARIEALAPDLEAYIAKGMADFDVPGLAIGIVSGDRLVWSKGFGTGSKGGAAVDTDTVFQIGSTTKAFLATTLALAVDRGTLAWDDRVVDRYPGFQMQDPWVTQEFRLFDLLAQRSGMPQYANDVLGMLGFSTEAMIHSMRDVEPVTSFRSSFAYTNVTHMLASEIVAQAFGQQDWASVVDREIFEPLGMSRSSHTPEAIAAAENTTIGHRYTPDGSVEVPFSQLFPYAFLGAGAVNSTVNDLVPWVRLQLGNGTIDGNELVTAENIAATRVPRVGLAPSVSYAMGWVQVATPGGLVTWHNGGTTGYGAYIGLAPDHDVAVVVLTNLQNVGMPDAVGQWALDRLLGNPDVDHLAATIERAKKAAAENAARFAVPAGAAAAPDLATLAGDYAGAPLGDVAVAVDGDGLLATIAQSGAALRLAPWDGPVLTATLVAEGKFADIAANLGPLPTGFVQFTAGMDGKVGVLSLLLPENGQTYRLTRK